MEFLSTLFPFIAQMPESMKAFCAIGGVTLVVCSVVVFVVLRGRKDVDAN